MNNEWIVLNLPYYVRLEDGPGPQYPDLSEKEKLVFGKSIVESKGNISEEDNKYFQDIRDAAEQTFMPEQDSSYPANKEVKEYILQNHGQDPIVEKIYAHRDFANKIQDWYAEQPEVIAVDKQREEFFAEIKRKESYLSFKGQGLNKPGVLIEVEHGDQVYTYLIGDINCLKGSCDDCTPFGDSAIVRRYKIVYEH